MESTTLSRPTRRDDLLAAAERIVRRDGVGRLTLDAVAVEAGTSKGGLLYHFASREALITAMVERHVDAFSASLEADMAHDPEPRGRWTRAYLHTTAPLDGPSDGATATGLLAAMASNPALADPLREQYAAWREQVADDGLPEADAMIVALAADGLWMADLLGFAAPTGERRARIFARLLAMASAPGSITTHSGASAAAPVTIRAEAPASRR
jgi:AcrR family transcriptional regulator